MLCCSFSAPQPWFGEGRWLWEHGPSQDEENTMVRIRGTIGSQPVDLTVELEDSDWQRLAAALRPPEAVASHAAAPASAPKSGGDMLWDQVVKLLSSAGRLSGPDILVALEKLTGNLGVAKQLLVRLRHSPQVRMERVGEAQFYIWQG
jgi:hypothetical protein